MPRQLTESIASAVIYQCAVEQNKFCTGLEHYAIRGYQNIDVSLNTREEEYTTTCGAAILNAVDVEERKSVT